MTLEQIVAAIRSLPVPERLRVIELAAHDVANDVSRGEAEPAPGHRRHLDRAAWLPHRAR
jgi:hypothetical protein